MPDVPLSDLKNTTCLFRLYAAFAARDKDAQEASMKGTSTGKRYTSNRYLLPQGEAVKHYLAQFPWPGLVGKVGQM